METQRRHRGFALALALTVIGLLLTGCANNAAPGKLARDWSCKIREMQVRPLFPPREDFHVGDVYWLETVGETDAQGYCSTRAVKPVDFMPLSMNLAYLPEVTKLAAAHYQARPDFGRTNSSVGTVTVSATGITIAAGSQSTDVTTGSDTLFIQGKPNRTRLVGFPDFMSVKIDKGSLGAILPIQGMFTSAGLSFENVAEASISIPVAESYGVPAALAVTTANASPSISQICSASVLSKQISEPGKAPPAGQIHLVTEVYYTRAIDVNIQSKNAVALGGAFNSQDAAVPSLPSVSPSGVVTSSAVASGSLTSATVSQMEAAAGGLVKILSARNAIPGVSLGYEHGSSSTINMRRIFDRPVAIGYRSVALKVVAANDGKGCSIEGIPSAAIGPAADKDKVAPTPPTGTTGAATK